MAEAMTDGSESVSQLLGNGIVEDTFPVKMSPEIVQLLSEQLYTSATKAIEELVVNAYDADAAECRIALLLEGIGAVPLEMAIQESEGALSSDDEAETDDNGSIDAPVRSLPPAADGLIAVFDDGEGMDVVRSTSSGPSAEATSGETPLRPSASGDWS